MPARSRTNRAPRVRPNWHDQNHIDLGAQDQRISNLENAIGDIGDQLREIGRRLEARPTDVWKIIGGVVTIISLVGGFLLIGKQPYDEGLARHDREIGRLVETAVAKDDFKTSIDLQQRRNLEADASREKLRDELEETRIELAKLEGASTERHEEYLRDHAETSAYVHTLDANLIKRPEIESGLAALRELVTLTSSAANNRVDTVVGSLNELRRDFGASWNIGDTVRAIEVRLNAMQLQPSFAAPPPASASPPR